MDTSRLDNVQPGKHASLDVHCTLYRAMNEKLASEHAYNAWWYKWYQRFGIGSRSAVKAYGQFLHKIIFAFPKVLFLKSSWFKDVRNYVPNRKCTFPQPAPKGHPHTLQLFLLFLDTFCFYCFKTIFSSPASRHVLFSPFPFFSCFLTLFIFFCF